MKSVPHLSAPPVDCSVMAFWFLNDELDRESLLTQMADFQAHGVHGLVLHPRVGLPRHLPWMSERLLDFYEIMIAEAARRGMKIILYDEAMYPSGASCGQVVAANPEFQCRGLALVEGEGSQNAVLPPETRLVARVVRANGSEVAVVERKVDSVIRGLHYVGEGPDEDSPAAADILNPAAVALFINLVYDGFAKRFQRYFGTTVIGIFTDEPSFLGRCRETAIMPGTTGILAEANRLLGYDFTPHLPALWFDDEPDAARYRRDWHDAMLSRLSETYYTPLQQWCEAHGLALMGHPEGPDHIASLRHFHIPGQDLVWRWVLPDQPTALEGPQSTQAKCSSSAMVHLGHRQNLNEYCGAYGHQFTWEEMNWLSNWCLVRGVNLLVPHAFYYSVRGVRRDERPPDVGPNSPWWDRYKGYAEACRRLCWINTDSQQVCRIAILGHAYSLPWEAAKVCYQSQYDFNYLEERQLLEEAVVEDSGIQIRGMHYERLIVETVPRVQGLEPLLRRLESSGRLIRFVPGEGAGERLCSALSSWRQPDVILDRAVPGLRVRHVIKESCHYFMLFNEAATTAKAGVTLPVRGPVFELDPETGSFTPVDPAHLLHIAPHAMRVLAVR